MIPTPQRERQINLYEFEASLAYKDNSRTDKATQRNTVLKKKKQSSKESNHKWFIVNIFKTQYKLGGKFLGITQFPVHKDYNYIET